MTVLSKCAHLLLSPNKLGVLVLVEVRGDLYQKPNKYSRLWIRSIVSTYQIVRQGRELLDPRDGNVLDSQPLTFLQQLVVDLACRVSS